ncbi:hypothetical protein BD309DRAFT_986202 [Dichomitus squalens]|uniref:Uncharacterized protein n=1 Tax=Dichomitus squalens TaxID=114155 RepID=A0A4Q9P5T6_9APHY|nr:uncharacterized protein DICSQDRAFT_144378 [Dichomitus squalens LYAD-421 SS1]EJF64619.1 hypothetical protein DICSQDRAFT_144378 [Dichomitus squalens LYAD-421 SS1]TBU32533.1 hypothetical protein BD311DRAFT_775180 [Dichomitus squalens]TBU49819.1 hypothetical protein BD309DRAFT_986202 [Dichomitus squalens]
MHACSTASLIPPHPPAHLQTYSRDLIMRQKELYATRWRHETDTGRRYAGLVL